MSPAIRRPAAKRCQAGVAASLITVVQDAVASGGSRLEVEVDEGTLVAALCAGDESAFRDLVKRHHASLIRLARANVASQAVAEEVAQDTWLAVIKGIGGFEGRSSLKTWIFRILVNQARKRGVREHRIIPMSALGADGSDGDAPVVDPDRFVPNGRPPRREGVGTWPCLT